MSRFPIVVILGSTGTGKSKLAVQLAKKFSGEIIGADSMQVYRGLDIASNKIPVHEREGIVHHMLDILQSTDRFTVLDYRNRALPIIEDISRRKKLPILVGGTNYYIESVLWKILVENSDLVSGQSGPDKLLHQPENRVLDFEYSRDAGIDEASFEREAYACECENYTDAQTSVLHMIEEFSAVVRKILSGTTVFSDLYLRTFYPVTKIENFKTATVPSSNPRQKIDILKTELSLITEYLKNCRQKCDQNDSNTRYLFDDLYTPESAARFLQSETHHDIRGETAFFGRLTENNSKKQILDTLAEILKTRVRRIILLQVVDDLVMPGFDDIELHNELKLIDPDIARKTHPKNRRKVIRALQVYLKFGRKQSDIFNQQKSEEGGNVLGGPMRFPNALVLWLKCDQKVLDERLDRRVDEMIEGGLIEELQQFSDQYNKLLLKSNVKADYELGIFQSIGLKEFHPYLMLNENEKKSWTGLRLRNSAIEAIKLVTKRYSKIQMKWVQNRFIKVDDARQVPAVYALDCTDTERWSQNVENVAYELVSHYLNDPLRREASPHKPVLTEKPHPDRFIEGEFYCNVCNKAFVGAYQWNIHMKSKSHWRAYYKVRKNAAAHSALKAKQSCDNQNTIVKPAVCSEPDGSIDLADEDTIEFVRLLMYKH